MKPSVTIFNFKNISNIAKEIDIHTIPKNGITKYLNKEIAKSDSEFICFIDDNNDPVKLKNSCLGLMQMAMQKNPYAGMVYADYDIVTEDKIEEIQLLKHHMGRVRDNQDYGKVILFRKSFLEQVGGFGEDLKYYYLYEIRLKLSEVSKIIHIANKKSGSLYQVTASKEKTNVFDYLLSDEAVQKEAEKILTGHLKRIDAYLSPKQKFNKRPAISAKPPKKASIIIPVNDRPDFIVDAIESALNQTFQDIEIIVIVNGGENDPTNQSVKRYMKGGDKYYNDRPQVRLITTDINNIGYCLNLGVKNAQSEYYVQLDSDDRLKPDAVEKILQKFELDTAIGMVVGSYEVWSKLDTGETIRDENIPVVTHPEWTDENGRNNLLRINGAGAPRAVQIQIIIDIGYFDMNENPFARNYGEDYDMVLRISEKYKIGRIYDPIYEVLRHSGGTDHSIDQNTINRNDEAKDWMRKEAILRRQISNR
ncbi:MAG: glycosyltransferase [Candidatus Neomarinimicrobiota bacterium]